MQEEKKLRMNNFEEYRKVINMVYHIGHALSTEDVCGFTMWVPEISPKTIEFAAKCGIPLEKLEGEYYHFRVPEDDETSTPRLRFERFLKSKEFEKFCETL